MQTKIKTSNIQVIGRRWFDRQWGNTYHSVEVYQDNKLIARIPFEYGYDDSYKQTAFQVLMEKGFYSSERYDNGMYKDYHKFITGDNILFSVTDVSRKRDL